MIPLYQSNQVHFQYEPHAAREDESRQTTSNAVACESSNSPVLMPVSTDLQAVIARYHNQPDLLRLILQSKVQEDKRRAEEAKLRAKELDLLLVQQRQRSSIPLDRCRTFSGSSSVALSVSNGNDQTHPTSSTENGLSTLAHLPATSTQWQHSMDFVFQNDYGVPSGIDTLLDTQHPLQYAASSHGHSSPLDSSLASSNTPSEDPEDRMFSPPSTNTNGLSSTAFDMNSYPSNMTLKQDSAYSPYTEVDMHAGPQSHLVPIQPTLPFSPSPPHAQSNRNDIQRPRRRREMQAITRIVETRDFPYLDGYFWKNNGNTVQKKTGNKSIYYKCSNSVKGCTVNKTVVWKENGEYLIKYRGEHLPDCSRVKRIVDV